MPTINGTDISKLVVACDAGMGSSVMLASTLASSSRRTRSRSSTRRSTRSRPTPTWSSATQGSPQRARGSARDKLIVPFQVFLGDPAVTGRERDPERRRHRWLTVAARCWQPDERSDSTQHAAGAGGRDPPVRRALVEVGAVEPGVRRRDAGARAVISTYVGRGRRDPARHARPARTRCSATPSRCCASRRRRLGRRRGDRLRSRIAAAGDGHVDDPRPARRGADGPGRRRSGCASRRRSPMTSITASGERGGSDRHEGRPIPRTRRRPHRGRARARRRPGRGEDPGPQLLDLRHRRQDLPARPPPHRPAARHGPRDRRRDRRGRRRRRRAGRPATGSRSSPPSRAGTCAECRRGRMTVCPNQDVDGLPLRRRVRRVHGRARATCSRSTGSTASPTDSASPRRRSPSRSPASSTARSSPGWGRATTWSSSAPGRSAACTSGWPAPAARPGCSWSTSTASASTWPPTWSSRTRRSAAAETDVVDAVLEAHRGPGCRRRHHRRGRRRGPGAGGADGGAAGPDQLLRRPAEGQADDHPATPTSCTTAS